MRYIVCTVVAGILLLATIDAPSVAQPGIASQLLLQTTTTIAGQPLEFVHSRDEVAAFLVELAPGGETGRMLHLFPMVVYVTAGTLSFEIPGQAARTVDAGQAFVAPLKSAINGVNRGATPVKFLAVYFGEREKQLLKSADSRPRGFRSTTVLQTAKTWTGEPIYFPLLTNQFTVQVVNVAPGAVDLRHVQTHIQFVYVLEGVLTLDASGYPRQTFNPGAAYVETTWPHAVGNRGTVGLRYLTIYAGEAGVPLTLPAP
jgi:quercetin dioxygenase-like cupin family protein